MKLVIKVNVKTIEEAQKVAGEFLRKVAYADMSDEAYGYVMYHSGGISFPQSMDYKEPFDAGVDLELES